MHLQGSWSCSSLNKNNGSAAGVGLESFKFDRLVEASKIIRESAFANEDGYMGINNRKVTSDHSVGQGDFTAVLNGVQFESHLDGGGYKIRMNCPSKTTDNSNFAAAYLATMTWTDFPLYKEMFDFVLAADKNRVVRETCFEICRVEAEGETDRSAVRTKVVANMKAKMDENKLFVEDTSKDVYGCTTLVPPPPVPADTMTGTVSDRIEAMTNYLKDFKNQKAENAADDYTKFFKPVLCYLEGVWEKDTLDREAFKASNHKKASEKWIAEHERLLFLRASGRTLIDDDTVLVPTAFRNALNGTDPELASWKFRVLCHPLDNDLPTSRFHAAVDQLTALTARFSGSAFSELRRAPESNCKRDAGKV